MVTSNHVQTFFVKFYVIYAIKGIKTIFMFYKEREVKSLILYEQNEGGGGKYVCTTVFGQTNKNHYLDYDKDKHIVSRFTCSICYIY